MKTILNEGIKILKGNKTYEGEVPTHILTPEIKEALPNLEKKIKEGRDAESKFFKSREPKKPIASVPSTDEKARAKAKAEADAKKKAEDEANKNK